MGKTILITGTSSGFGKDSAETLARAGHRVFATMRGVNGSSNAAADELRAKGIEVLELDVTLDTSVDVAFEDLRKKAGDQLDVVINNAGVFAQGISESFTPAQVGAMFDVNVTGVQRVTRAALPLMRKHRSGLIVNFGSILGRLTIPFVGLYGATKFAVEALTESYRYELSQLGIDVVLVQPGPFPTSLYSSLLKAGDPGRASEYGDVAAVPGAIVKALQGILSGPNAPNPHQVAEALVKLVATPAGQRPDRIVVGSPFGADAVNKVVQPIQEQFLAGFGLTQLNTLKESPA